MFHEFRSKSVTCDKFQGICLRIKKLNISEIGPGDFDRRCQDVLESNRQIGAEEQAANQFVEPPRRAELF